MANATPSQEFEQRCQEDFKNRLEGAIRIHCSREENHHNVLITKDALKEFMRQYIIPYIRYNMGNSEYTVTAYATAEIQVTGLGRFTKAAVGGGAGGAAVGAVGAGGAGAGIGALIGIIGGPIGVGIGVAVGAGAGAAMGGATGVVAGGGFGAWIATKFGKDISITWRQLYRKLANQRSNDNSNTLSLTFRLNTSSQ